MEEKLNDIKDEDIAGIKMCVDKFVPLEFDKQAEQVALNERASNAPNANPNANERLALITGKMWKNGRTLRVAFLDGTPKMQEKVRKYADVWSEFANINFEFGDDPDAEIRISFKADPGSWSAVGTDALVQDAFPPGEPTMNFGWLREDTDDEEYSRVVTHEFGHALGCIHEHQNPTAGVKWNKPLVYRYYMSTQDWSKETVDHNLFERYSEDMTQFTEFDRGSIMIYRIPKELTLDGQEYPTNTVLSQKDQEFIAKEYPKE